MKTRNAGTGKKNTPPAKGGAVEVDPRFAPVVEAFARDRQVSYGKMFASIGLKVNGKIFSMHVKGKFVAKLPKERVDELVRQGKGDYFDPGHGRLMKEWVALTGGQPSWVELAREAHRFVKSDKA
jgi:TfoX/Sxy family transcriptional regulator of competence genes